MQAADYAAMPRAAEYVKSLSAADLQADAACSGWLRKRSEHVKQWNKRWFVLWPSANRPGDGRVLFWFDKPVRCPETSLSPRLPTLTPFGRRAPLRCAGRQEGKGQRQAHPGLLQPTVPRRQGEGRPRLPAHRPHRSAEPRPGTRHAQRAAPFFWSPSLALERICGRLLCADGWCWLYHCCRCVWPLIMSERRAAGWRRCSPWTRREPRALRREASARLRKDPG